MKQGKMALIKISDEARKYVLWKKLMGENISMQKLITRLLEEEVNSNSQWKVEKEYRKF